MTEKPFILAMAFGVLTLLVLRPVALPVQLNRVPYHDMTLGEDLLRICFLEVPTWVYGASVLASALMFWFLKRNITAIGHPTAGLIEREKSPD